MRSINTVKDCLKCGILLTDKTEKLRLLCSYCYTRSLEEKLTEIVKQLSEAKVSTEPENKLRKFDL